MSPRRPRAKSTLDRATKMKERLLPHSMAGKATYVRAVRYHQNMGSARLGRNPITDPRAFNSAEDAALRAERNAVALFRSPGFRKEGRTLSPTERSEVIERYRSIRRVAGNLRRIGRMDRTQHQQSPELLAKRTFTADILRTLQNPKGQTFTVGLIDLDNFKKINTQWGYPAGDAALRFMAKSLFSWVKHHGGYAARVGGEEYQFFLPHGLQNSALILEQFRRKLIQSTRDPSFFKKMGLLSIPKGWRRTLNFSAALTSVSNYSRVVNEKKMYASLSEGVNIAKKAKGKGSAVYMPWEEWTHPSRKPVLIRDPKELQEVKTDLH